MSHIPEHIDELFVPELGHKIQSLTKDATLQDVVELCNDIVEVLNLMIDQQAGEPTHDDHAKD